MPNSLKSYDNISDMYEQQLSDAGDWVCGYSAKFR
jgi:hypothetical protein